MDLKTFQDTLPWEWPEDAGRIFLKTLRDDQANASDRLLAAELAGDFVVISDEVVDGLLSVVCNGEESEELRCRAVISMGPALEYADMDGFDDFDYEGISEGLFNKIRDSLRKLYRDADISKKVRRQILEASVRAPQDWHQDAVRAAYFSNETDWKLTAVFCMRFVRGFEDRILEALENENQDIFYQAVCAAGNWEVDEAWPHIAEIMVSEDPNKDLLLAAIEASVGIRPQEAADILGGLIDSDDQDVVDAAYEALGMARFLLEGESDEDDFMY